METLDIIHAAQGRSLNAYPIDDARESVRSHVDRAYNLAEVPLPNGPDYEVLVNEITDKILKSYPYMTSQELALVAESGVAGELGGRTRPSAAAFFGWIASYMNSDLRKEAIRNYRRGNSGDPASRLLTPDERATLNRQAGVRMLTTLWNEYKRLGRISDDHLDGYVAGAYDYAMECGLFNVSPEFVEKARMQAKTDWQRRSRMTGLAAMLNEYVPQFHMKRILLGWCFNGQRNTGKDLVIPA